MNDLAPEEIAIQALQVEGTEMEKGLDLLLSLKDKAAVIWKRQIECLYPTADRARQAAMVLRGSRKAVLELIGGRSRA